MQVESGVLLQFRHPVARCVNVGLNVQDNGPDDWMTRYFFSGGTMVSLGLLYHFQVSIAI